MSCKLITYQKGILVSFTDLNILETLIFYGEMNMSQLSTKTWKQNANITRIVDKLEKQKLLIRKAQPEDRRTNLISVTKEGKHIFKQTMPIIIETNKSKDPIIITGAGSGAEDTAKDLLKDLIEFSA